MKNGRLSCQGDVDKYPIAMNRTLLKSEKTEKVHS